jgi:hypothetical protein
VLTDVKKLNNKLQHNAGIQIKQRVNESSLTNYVLPIMHPGSDSHQGLITDYLICFLFSYWHTILFDVLLTKYALRTGV